MIRHAFCLLAAAIACQAEPKPLLLVLGLETAAWTAAAQERGWASVEVAEATPNDAGVRALEAAIDGARKSRDIDPDRIYLAGRGDTTATVFYAISRRPGVWAAAIAAGGTPLPAAESNRLFGANAALVPLLWATPPSSREVGAPLQSKLGASGFAIETPNGAVSLTQALDWLAAHKREPYPQKVDCESGNPEFARCYWVSIEKFDPAQRNDALSTSRVVPGSGAYLAIGGFGFSTKDPGPGVLVTWLPANYSGPLKLNDRILSIGGKPLADASGYQQLMDTQKDARTVGLIVLRGKDRIRIETRIAFSKHEEAVTAQVQAQFLSDSREMLVITRGVGALRLDVPAYWVPFPVNWNGQQAGTVDSGGCWLLVVGQHLARCP